MRRVGQLLERAALQQEIATLESRIKLAEELKRAEVPEEELDFGEKSARAVLFLEEAERSRKAGLNLDALWQLTGFNLAWRGWPGAGYALGVGNVKFTGMVRPDRKVLRYEVDFTKTVKSRRLTMGVADGKMYADGELLYETTDMKVAFSDA